MPKEYADSWIRTRREARGMTQGELALAVRVSKAAINHFERGSKRPGLATAERIAELLDLPVQLVRVGTGNVRTPSEIAELYISDCERKLAESNGQSVDLSWVERLDRARKEAEAEGLSYEEWNERRQELEAERSYEQMTDEQVAAWKPLTVVLDDGTEITEQPPRSFLVRVQRVQQHRGGQ